MVTSQNANLDSLPTCNNGRWRYFEFTATGSKQAKAAWLAHLEFCPACQQWKRQQASLESKEDQL